MRNTPDSPPVATGHLPSGRLADAGGGLLSYGFLGLPLAFAALPLYLLLPDWYARQHGMPLALIGLLLLSTRLADALVDPFIGLWVERLRALAGSYRVSVWAGLPLLGAGFTGLFYPPPWALAMLPAWACLMLVVTNLGLSTTTIAWQSWGAEMGESSSRRARISAVREGFGIAGVLLASVIPSIGGMSLLAASLVSLLALAAALLFLVPPHGGRAGAAAVARRPAGVGDMGNANNETPAPMPGRMASRAADRFAASATSPPTTGTAAGTLWSCLRDRNLRRLLLVFAVNGIAAALPATLLLFFVRDSLGLESQAPTFLAIYFLMAALAMPFWVRLAARRGLVRAWLAGMLLSVASFAWVMLLPGADPAWAWTGFALVCAVSGIAVAADLAIPAALLAGLIKAAGHGGAEGRYFGVWNLVLKLNLALAAGGALPLLQMAGYEPGNGHALALTLMYGALPCVMKLCAAALLWRWRNQLETN